MTFLASLFLHALQILAPIAGVGVLWKLLTDPWGTR